MLWALGHVAEGSGYHVSHLSVGDHLFQTVLCDYLIGAYPSKLVRRLDTSTLKSKRQLGLKLHKEPVYYFPLSALRVMCLLVPTFDTSEPTG